jgi:hypothetical protein
MARQSIEEQAWFKQFLEEFPQWAWLVEDNLEVRGIISQWWHTAGRPVVGGEGGDYNSRYNSLLAQIKQSDWWRLTEKPLRDSIILREEEPGTWDYNVKITVEDIRRIGQTKGWLFTNSYIEGLAQQAETYDWDAAELTRRMGVASRFKKNLVGSGARPTRGEEKRNLDSIKDYADSMLVHMPKTKAELFANRIAGGEAGAFKDAYDWIENVAGAEWDFIDIHGLAERGLNLRDDVLGTTREDIASILELNIEDVNLLGIGTDDLIVGEGDSRRFWNRQEAESWAKKQSRYQMSDEFRGGVVGLAGAIAGTWGYR